VRSKNFLDDLPDDMNNAWPWVCAIDAWDYNDAAPLAELISIENIPEPLRPIVANIVGGVRLQKKKAAAKLKIPASERMKVAASLSCVLGLCDTIRLDIIDTSYPGMKGAVMLSYRGVQDPIDIITEMRKESAGAVQLAMEEFGVSTETIENLLRDLRKKINNWPNV